MLDWSFAAIGPDPKPAADSANNRFELSFFWMHWVTVEASADYRNRHHIAAGIVNSRCRWLSDCYRRWKIELQIFVGPMSGVGRESFELGAADLDAKLPPLDQNVVIRHWQVRDR